MEKILLLYSGGLDSRLAAKILKDKRYDLTAVFFRLPFASWEPSGKAFLDNEAIPLKVFDCTCGRLLVEYLEVLRHPQHGRGKGYNPCLDCKLFMVRKLNEHAPFGGYTAIATGEVPGQRPMSQTSSQMKVIEKASPLPLIRPLAEMGINGKSRKKQIQLAKHYDIDFPSPGGGCLLCEKDLSERFKTLIEGGMVNEKTLPLFSLGRHFYDERSGTWFVVGRDKNENDVIERYQNAIPSGKGKPAVYYQDPDNEGKAKTRAERLQKAYEHKDRQAIHEYGKWKL